MGLDFVLINRENFDVEFTDDRIKQFERVFSESFPNDDEREDVGAILERIRKDDRGVSSVVMVVLDEGDVIAACVADKYRVKPHEIIYIFVRRDVRREGIGRELCRRMLSYLGGTAFVEIDDPEKPQPPVRQEISVEGRIKFYEAFGLSDCVKGYFQPPLSEGKGWASNMKLCSLGRKPDSHEIARFLDMFYHSLGYGDTEEGMARLNEMRHELGV